MGYESKNFSIELEELKTILTGYVARTLQKCCCTRVGSLKNTLFLEDQTRRHAPDGIFEETEQHS